MEVSRIIFVGKYGTIREPMAKGILEDFSLKKQVEVLAKGLVVQFPEPMNQKTEAVLISNGITLESFMSQQIVLSDITETTLVFTMEDLQRQHLIEMFPEIPEQQFCVLTSYVGEELEVLNPYGGTIQTYGLCFESLRKSLKKLADMINNGDVQIMNGEEINE